MAVKEEVSLPVQGICTRCNFVSSQAVCKACVLLEGLNKGLPRLGIGKSSKAKKMLDEYNSKNDKECLDPSNDFTDSDNCKSEGRPCRTGLCNTKSKIIDKCDTNCCKENKDVNGAVKGNSKVNKLLQEYGIEHEKVRDMGSDQESQIYKPTNANDGSDNEDLVLTGQDEDNTCAGACGTMGSLNIGF